MLQFHLIGVISDTHGLLRPEAIKALVGIEQIIHAGDVDQPEILSGLKDIAPTVAVRGNIDYGTWAQALRQTRVVEVGAVRIYVIHNLGDLAIDPAAYGYRRSTNTTMTMTMSSPTPPVGSAQLLPPCISHASIAVASVFIVFVPLVLLVRISGGATSCSRG